MIYYFVTERQAGPIRHFLETSAPPLVGRLAVVTYEMLLAGRLELPEREGSYIFTNLGTVRRMEPDARATIFALHDRLVESRGAAHVLNDPARSLLRYDLLQLLHDRGINSFNAYRTDGPLEGLRYPAFIRHELHSQFTHLTLAQNAQQYGALVNGVTWQQGSRKNLITVEFCDTAGPDGFYRKYGAFVVGGRIVPRHVFVSRNWSVRNVDLVDPPHLAAELEYLNTNPHEEALLKCAQLAGIAYGRIDYSLLEGRPQLWEINTNAAFVSQEASAERRPGLEKFVATFADAMLALDPED
jgi:hypothetical protein